MNASNTGSEEDPTNALHRLRVVLSRFRFESILDLFQPFKLNTFFAIALHLLSGR